MKKFISQLKKDVYITLSYNRRFTLPNKLFTFFISTLIIINTLLVIFSSFPDIYEQSKHIFVFIETSSIVIFSIEYILRLWIADYRNHAVSRTKAIMGYVFSPMGLIDLMAIIPFYLQIFVESNEIFADFLLIRSLRTISLLRFVTFSKHGFSIQVFVDVIRDLRFELTATYFIIFIFILVISSFIYTVEHKVQPDKFKTMGDAMWLAIITLSTVGFGDVYPITNIGKMLTGFLALLGFSMFTIPSVLISAAFVQKMKEYKEKKLHLVHYHDDDLPHEAEPIEYCPHCGHRLYKH